MAAALSYRSLFGMIPVLVIGLLVFGSLMSAEQIEDGVKRTLHYAGIGQIDLDKGDEPRVEDDGEQADQPGALATDETAGGDDPAVDEAGDQSAELEEFISNLVRQVNTSIREVPTAQIAIIMALVLLYAAISMFVEIERAFNHLYRAPSGRAWHKRIVLYWTVLTLGSALLLSTFWVGDLFTGWVAQLGGGGSGLLGLLGFLVTVVISTVLLLVAYTTIPNASVRFRSALGGAVLAAVLWEIGKWGFGSYVRYAAGYERIYGSLALLPLFLVWVYVTWIIVLFGLQVSYALQNFGSIGGESEGPRLIDPASVLVIAVETARRFAAGKPATMPELAESAGLPESAALTMLEALAQAGVVQRVVVGDDDRWSMARPPETVPAGQVVELAGELTEIGRNGKGTALDGVRRAGVESLAGKSLADLVGAKK